MVHISYPLVDTGHAIVSLYLQGQARLAQMNRESGPIKLKRASKIQNICYQAHNTMFFMAVLGLIVV